MKSYPLCLLALLSVNQFAVGQNVTTNVTLADPVLFTTEAPTEGSTSNGELDTTVDSTTASPTDAATSATTTNAPEDEDPSAAVQTASPTIRGTVAATTVTVGATPLPAPTGTVSPLPAPTGTVSPTPASTTAGTTAAVDTEAPADTTEAPVLTETPTEAPIEVTAAPSVAAGVNATSAPTTATVVTGTPTVVATIVATGAPSTAATTVVTGAPSTAIPVTGAPVTMTMTMAPTFVEDSVLDNNETILEDAVDDSIVGNDTDVTQEIPVEEDDTTDGGDEVAPTLTPAVSTDGGDGECAIEPIGNTDFACQELLKFTSSQCDCSVFCAGKLIACLSFGERASYSCSGETVAGCNESQRNISGALGSSSSSTVVLLLSMLAAMV